MKKKPTNEIELSTLVNEAETELLKQKQAAIRERAKPILKHKEAMEKSIAECEKDLERARAMLVDFSAKLRDVEENDDMATFEELEKIIREGKTRLYSKNEDVSITWSVPYTYTIPALCYGGSTASTYTISTH